MSLTHLLKGKKIYFCPKYDAMINLLYKSRCWLAFFAICLLAACNTKSEKDNFEMHVREIEEKYNRGEDISHDTIIFEARRHFNLSEDKEMKTLSTLYSGCVYWQQCDYDSAMAALNEAIVLARASEDFQLMRKVQQTVSELNADLDRSGEMMEAFVRRRKILIIVTLSLAAAVMTIGFLVVRASSKRQKIKEMNNSIGDLQKECENLAETNRENLFQKAMIIYKVFLIGENKGIDRDSFQKLKSCVCGKSDNAYNAIYEAYSQVNPEVVKHIKTSYPNLADWEYKICILTMMPFSVKEVADILKVSPAAIGKGRTSIRKKIGMTEAGGNIAEFILNEMNQ